MNVIMTVYMFTADVVYCDSVSFLEQHFVFIEVSSCLFPLCWLLLIPPPLLPNSPSNQTFFESPFLLYIFLPETSSLLFQSVQDVCLFVFNFKKFFGHTTQPVGSQLPDQGSNPSSKQWKCRVLTTGPPGKAQSLVFFMPTVLLLHWYIAS